MRYGTSDPQPAHPPPHLSPVAVARPARAAAGRMGVHRAGAARHNGPMSTPASSQPGAFARIYAWRRLALALGIATVMGLLISPNFVANTPAWQVIVREMVLSLSCLTAFGVFERWPRRLPSWVARWAIQVLAVAIVIPPTVLIIY